MYPGITYAVGDANRRGEIQLHDGWYYWRAGGCYGSAYSEEQASQRVALAFEGKCVNCGHHERERNPLAPKPERPCAGH